MNAVTKSHDYDAGLIPLAKAGKTGEEIFWDLGIEDIQAAADLLRPLYDESNKEDGYVSLEVNPYLANDTLATLSEAKPSLEAGEPAEPDGQDPCNGGGPAPILSAIEAESRQCHADFSRERHWQ